MIETVWSGVTWKSGDMGVTNLQFSGIWSEVNTRLFEQYLARQSLVLLLLRICHALTHATLWEFIIKFFVELSHSANNDQSYLHFIQIPECLNFTWQICICSYCRYCSHSGRPLQSNWLFCWFYPPQLCRVWWWSPHGQSGSRNSTAFLLSYFQLLVLVGVGTMVCISR